MTKLFIVIKLHKGYWIPTAYSALPRGQLLGDGSLLLTPATATAPLALTSKVCELVLKFQCSNLMTSLQWGLEYVLRAVVLSKPTRISVIIKQAGPSCGTLVARPYGTAYQLVRQQEPQRRALGWLGPDLGPDPQKTQPVFHKNTCVPCKTSPIEDMGWCLLST